MTKLNLLSTEISEGILTLTINRPDKLNALNSEVLKELEIAVDEMYNNKYISGMIITGAGEKAFVAGADIGEISSLTVGNAESFALNGQRIFSKIENSPKPVIAAVNGFALGGGCELAMACHIRVATLNARFGQPEVNLGLIPGYGGTQRLTQLVGKGKAMEWMATADLISADEALQWGLTNHVVADIPALIQKSRDILTKIFTKAPVAVEHIIRCVNTVYHYGENGYCTEASSFSHLVGTQDFKEGTMAFLEKRKAAFQGV